MVRVMKKKKSKREREGDSWAVGHNSSEGERRKELFVRCDYSVELWNRQSFAFASPFRSWARNFLIALNNALGTAFLAPLGPRDSLRLR